VIYHGVWGQAPFQGVNSSAATFWEHLLELPELYLLNTALVLLSALGLLWKPMFAFVPLLCIGAGYPLVRAVIKGRHARFTLSRRSDRLRLRAFTAVLHVIQPLARLCGRLQHGLTPWRTHRHIRAVLPYRRQWAIWTEDWIDPCERLCRAEQSMAESGVTVRRGNAHQVWDLEVMGGLLGSARLLMAIEDHGSGTQYVRFAAWPRYSAAALVLSLAGIAIMAAAVLEGAFPVAAVLGAASALLVTGGVLEGGRSLATILEATQPEQQIGPFIKIRPKGFESYSAKAAATGLRDGSARTSASNV
jgi:hypothetical protein